jgi:hypothetical protein
MVPDWRSLADAHRVRRGAVWDRVLPITPQLLVLVGLIGQLCREGFGGLFQGAYWNVRHRPQGGTQSARREYGPMAFETGLSSRSEDFSTFTNVISGCFVFVNGGDAGEGRPDMNHHPRFNIVQSSLAAGLKTEVIVLDVLCDGWSGYG